MKKWSVRVTIKKVFCTEIDADTREEAEAIIEDIEHQGKIDELPLIEEGIDRLVVTEWVDVKEVLRKYRETK